MRIGDSFYRIDDDLPVTADNSPTPAYAQLGAENSLWVALLEKAHAVHRRQNRYASLINPILYSGSETRSSRSISGRLIQAVCRGRQAVFAAA